MKHLTHLLVLVIAATGFLSRVIAAIPDDVASANQSLISGHSAQALASYQTILNSPEFAKSGSPELWYNLGLAEEKTGDLVAASLSFRRALLLDPTLTIAHSALTEILATLGIPISSTTTGWRELILGKIHPKNMIVGGAILGWLGVFLLVVALMAKPRRASLIAIALVAIVMGHGCTIFGSLIDPRRTAASEAVVTAKNAPALRANPADSAESSGSLLPGSLITVLSRNGMWWYVANGSGQSGWIPSNTATPLLPGTVGY